MLGACPLKPVVWVNVWKSFFADSRQKAKNADIMVCLEVKDFSILYGTWDGSSPWKILAAKI